MELHSRKPANFATKKKSEALWVPEFWGHGTLAEEPCVAVAQEFIPLDSVFS